MTKTNIKQQKNIYTQARSAYPTKSHLLSKNKKRRRRVGISFLPKKKKKKEHTRKLQLYCNYIADIPLKGDIVLLLLFVQAPYGRTNI